MPREGALLGVGEDVIDVGDHLVLGRPDSIYLIPHLRVGVAIAIHMIVHGHTIHITYRLGDIL